MHRCLPPPHGRRHIPSERLIGGGGGGGGGGRFGNLPPNSESTRGWSIHGGLGFSGSVMVQGDLGAELPSCLEGATMCLLVSFCLGTSTQSPTPLNPKP